MTDLLLRSGGSETLRLLAEVALLEDEPEHVLFENRETRRIYRRQSIFIDDHGLALDPLTPAFGGHVVIYPLT
jgi:hypothetical protein